MALIRYCRSHSRQNQGMYLPTPPNPNQTQKREKNNHPWASPNPNQAKNPSLSFAISSICQGFSCDGSVPKHTKEIKHPLLWFSVSIGDLRYSSRSRIAVISSMSGHNLWSSPSHHFLLTTDHTKTFHLPTSVAPILSYTNMCVCIWAPLACIMEFLLEDLVEILHQRVSLVHNAKLPNHGCLVFAWNVIHVSFWIQGNTPIFF